jgi:hypothetical protein
MPSPKTIYLSLSKHTVDPVLKKLYYLMDMFKSHQVEKDNGKYYYQYEFDSNQTTYECLMGLRIISIFAHSYEEAMLLNVCLRVIFDGHSGSMDNYDEDHMNDENEYEDDYEWYEWEDDDYDEEELNTLRDMFDKIIKSDNLKDYEDYVTDTVFDPKVKQIGFKSRDDQTLAFDDLKMVLSTLKPPDALAFDDLKMVFSTLKPYVFGFNDVMKIITDLKFKKYYKKNDNESRIKFLLTV